MSKAKLKISKTLKPLNRPVTIIILTYNAVSSTISLIDSINEITLPENAKVLFVDNHSNDYTVDYIMKYNEFELIINGQNLGFSKAVNIGIQQSDPSHDIVLLNNDTALIQKNWLHLLQETAYLDSIIGPVGCRLINDLGNVVYAGGWVNPITCAGGNVPCGVNQRRFPLLTSYVTFGCVYLKRDVINQCGLLYPEYFAYCEDLDYCLVARTKGLLSIMDGRVNVLHTEGASSLANPHIDINAIKERSQIILSERWSKIVRSLPLPELLEGRTFKKMATYPIWH